MRALHKVLLPAAIVLAWVTPSMADVLHCWAPEIDAHSGMSAVAAIVAVALIAHHRRHGA